MQHSAHIKTDSSSLNSADTEIRQGSKEPCFYDRQVERERVRVSEGIVCLFISSLRAGRYRGMAALQGQYFTLACAL